MKLKLFTKSVEWKYFFRFAFLLLTMIGLGNNLKAQNHLDLKFYIQGYYIGNSYMTPALFYGYKNAHPGVTNIYSTTDVDWVTIELHSGSAPYNLVESFTGILQTNGHIICDFAASGEFYIAIQLRNAIKTWSLESPTNELVPRDVLVQVPGTFDFSVLSGMDPPYSTNAFSDGFNYPLTQMYFYHSPSLDPSDPPFLGASGVEGEIACNPALILCDGVWKIYSGDVDQDGVVMSLDATNMENDINAGLGGIINTDLDGDGAATILDYEIIKFNGILGVFESRPY